MLIIKQNSKFIQVFIFFVIIKIVYCGNSGFCCSVDVLGDGDEEKNILIIQDEENPNVAEEIVIVEDAGAQLNDVVNGQGEDAEENNHQLMNEDGIVVNEEGEEGGENNFQFMDEDQIQALADELNPDFEVDQEIAVPNFILPVQNEGEDSLGTSRSSIFTSTTDSSRRD
ncbi:unnamed protein product [Meloidogyne enterolobii]|uniref:Uncharacterized protein n=1 Tax=Meloidogyne enterolobii TaxID=390850 RepID=A0ACB0YAB3_MELEN